MSNRMSLLPFHKLILWILKEYESEKSIFGIPSDKFYKKSNNDNLSLFNTYLENPLGPAAGPNTQLAQNIIASYLTGCRFFELKTVQCIDGEDLPVSKPCILVKEEGYNVEWSTELTIPNALGEYIKAWFVLNIVSREFSLGANNGFIFNMSIGYDLAGIKSPKVNTFIENLQDASKTKIWKECKDFLLHNIQLFKNVSEEFIEGISPKICNSVTLSTLHGCPSTEIEKIAMYLLEEKKLHTYVKCNPTLLGYGFVRDTFDRNGYEDLEFDDHHFKNDLKFEEAIQIFTRLKAQAKKLGLTFGVKLSNTFPVKILNKELPGEEMYLSGRPLYPLTINLAYKLAKVFDGDLRISYSGGADFFTIDRIYQTGIWPITIATTILKPGGYLRLKQIAEKLESKELVSEFKGIDLKKLQLLANEAITDVNYGNNRQLKNGQFSGKQKCNQKVPLTNCFIAPCKLGCPIGQDIPEYLRLTGEGRYLEALEVITLNNPLPFITGTLCNHRCMSKCTRQNYEEPIRIKEVKLLAAQKAYDELIDQWRVPAITSKFKVAVIGGGPAGLTAAYFLAKNGIDVTVFDKRDEIGGIVQHIIPDFRISKEAILKDMKLVRKMGMKFRLGVEVEFSIEALKKEGFQYIFLAIGASKQGLLKLETCDKEIWNALEFLEVYHNSPETLQLGKKVAVIGAGNSAMDAARAAKRVTGVENVTILYRRTRKYMTADHEELEAAIREEIEFKELLSPLAYNKGILKCQKMVLGAPDASGRRSPEAIEGEFVEISVDSIISAIGEQVDTKLFVRNHMELDKASRILVNPDTNETSIENVFIGGDALRGPSSIVEAMADGIKLAQIIMKREYGVKDRLENEINEEIDFNHKNQLDHIKYKKGILQNACSPDKEFNRCLECHRICNLCTEVCPNRANLTVKVKSKNVTCQNQIVHIDGMCNSCGNCESFCPYNSAPYKDKFTFYWNLEDFWKSDNAGFILLGKEKNSFRVRLYNKQEDISFDRYGNCTGNIPKELTDIIWTVYQDYSYVF